MELKMVMKPSGRESSCFEQGFILCFLAVLMLLWTGSCLAAAQVSGDDLGRLFTTAGERHVLNRLRERGLVQDAVDLSSSRQNRQESGQGSVILNGVVKRADGDRVVWINGKQISGRQGPEGVRLFRGPDQDGQVVVTVPGKRGVKLKPGQRLQIQSGKVVENYLDGDAKPAEAVSP